MTTNIKIGTVTPDKIYHGSTEITKAYMGSTLVWEPAGGASTLLNGLLAYWDFDEASGALVNQLGDTNFNGTLFGGVTQNQAGKVGTSYLFNGTTGYINLPNETFDLSVTDFTIDCWAKSPNLGAARFILDKRDGANDGIVFYLNLATPTFQINSLSATGSNLSINTWYHLLVTVDRDGNAIFYVNNSAGTPVDISASGNIAVTTKAKIGSRSFSTPAVFFNGNLDEMGIWNRILTVPEIAERYNSGNGNTYPF